jgi:hypothetical protein
VAAGTYRVRRQRTDGAVGNYRPQWMADQAGHPRVNGSPFDQDPLSGLPASSQARQIWAQNFERYQALAFNLDVPTTWHSTTGTTLEVPVTLPPNAVEYLSIDEVRIPDARRVFTTRATYELFGSRCAVTGPRPSLTAQPGSLPRTGSTLVTNVTHLTTGARPLMFVGLSNTSWNGVPLPFDLSAVGLPGCELLASPDIVIPLPNLNGTATLSLGIPLNPQLHGIAFYKQAFIFSSVLHPASVSNGAIATIGQ